jgi:hypothetical protein
MVPHRAGSGETVPEDLRELLPHTLGQLSLVRHHPTIVPGGTPDTL